MRRGLQAQAARIVAMDDSILSDATSRPSQVVRGVAHKNTQTRALLVAPSTLPVEPPRGRWLMTPHNSLASLRRNIHDMLLM